MATNQLMVKMILDRWHSLMKTFNTNLDSIPDEQLQKEIARGRNRGVYILGHLIAVHEAMLPLLNLGEAEHPELFKTFVTSPDKSVEAIPSASELRALWKSQMESLTPKLASLTADEWFEKHNSVSAEDFEKEPHRNKLNVLLTRTTHLSYHAGQLRLLN
ncbi:MAG: DinB family protein [Bacteroidota bacterium]|nr:DinB family protein [Bacteroidota bacterium]